MLCLGMAPIASSLNNLMGASKWNVCVCSAQGVALLEGMALLE